MNFINTVANIAFGKKEVLAGSIIFGLAAGGLSYKHESQKRGQIPLAFSELGQIKQKAEWSGTTLPPLTLYYASLNDTLMQVFEANNLAYKGSFISWDDKVRGFAYELEKKIDPSMRIHTQIPVYTKRLPGYAENALGSVAKLAEANQHLPAIIDAMDRSWQEYHHDVTRTVEKTVQVCDKDGKNCKTEVTTEQVYDHTNHTYIYDPENGIRAAQLLQAFIVTYPDLKINEMLVTAPQTNADNEWAIRQSRKYLPGYKEPSQDEYNALKDIWATGSNYMNLTPVINSDHEFLSTKLSMLDQAANTAKRRYHYSTYSHSDSGPKQFQVAEKFMDVTVDESRNISAITGGMEYTKAEILTFEDDITRFVNAALHGGEGNAKNLGKAVLQQARSLYISNYSGGFNPYTSNWAMVIGLSLAGVFAGGLGGLGVARVRDQRANRIAFQ